MACCAAGDAPPLPWKVAPPLMCQTPCQTPPPAGHGVWRWLVAAKYIGLWGPNLVLGGWVRLGARALACCAIGAADEGATHLF